MFAPNHRAAAEQLVRVCRPGGTIGMMNFTPGGTGGEFFALLAPYAPPPPGPDVPVSWGNEDHVRNLFGGAVSDLTMTRHTYRRARSESEDTAAVQGNLRTAGRHPRQPRGHAGEAGGAGSSIPGGGRPVERRPIDRTGRDPLRVSARDRAQGRGQRHSAIDTRGRPGLQLMKNSACQGRRQKAGGRTSGLTPENRRVSLMPYPLPVAFFQQPANLISCAQRAPAGSREGPSPPS